MIPVFYFTFGLLVVSWALHNLVRHRGNVMRSPLSLFGIGIAVVHGFVPALERTANLNRFLGAPYSDEAHFLALILAALCLIGATLGLRLVPFRATARSTSAFETPLTHAIFFIIVLIPSLYASYYIASRYNIFVLNFMQDRILALSDAGVYLVLSGVSALIPAYFIVAGIGKQRGFIVRFLISIIALAAISVLTLFTGSRNTIFFSAICWIIAIFAQGNAESGSFNKAARGLQVSAITLLVFLGVILAGFQSFRESISRGERVNYGAVAEIAGDDLTSGIAWNLGNNESVLWIIDNPHEKHFGRTYLAGLVVVVPRRIWPEKPLGAGPYLRNEIRPGTYVLGGRGNSSYTTGLITESIMNFSFIGPPIISILLGICFGLVRNGYFRSQNPVKRTLFIFLMASLTVTFLYSEFLGWFARVIAATAVLAIASVLAARVAGRRSTPTNRLATSAKTS